jgi:hypothetical protein
VAQAKRGIFETYLFGHLSLLAQIADSLVSTGYSIISA